MNNNTVSERPNWQRFNLETGSQLCKSLKNTINENFEKLNRCEKIAAISGLISGGILGIDGLNNMYNYNVFTTILNRVGYFSNGVTCCLKASLGFSTCVSSCHAVPDPTIFSLFYDLIYNRDIVSIEIECYYNSFFGEKCNVYRYAPDYTFFSLAKEIDSYVKGQIKVSYDAFSDATGGQTWRYFALIGLISGATGLALRTYQNSLKKKENTLYSIDSAKVRIDLKTNT